MTGAVDDRADQREAVQTERTIRSLEDLHNRHHREISKLVRFIGRTTAVLAAPSFVGAVALFVFTWIVVNTTGRGFGVMTFDPYPFQLLELIGTIFAVVTTLLILATQSQENKLDERRSQLTLQMAALAEQKSAKIISLLEEIRRDSPQLKSRTDAEAEEMASPSDLSEVMDRIAETHAQRIGAASAIAIPAAKAPSEDSVD